ncbi:MAG: NYN domain-containing protein [Candidatus Eisenbacteria bacterium]|uniref:NYN domain-containing protein n=1 Tax=Eiseniibacteriota bacterium TaxID=2212470 RepID=A0A933SC24_UNCEI|nr:NYN domain-containing protein [Candidatus Eisenbacteria bacterium]
MIATTFEAPASQSAQHGSRVALFVDGENLYGYSHSLGTPHDMHYEALLAYAARLGALEHSAIYLGAALPSDGLSRFMIALKHQGFTRVKMRLRRPLADGRQKSCCDMIITMEAWEAALSGRFDKVVFVTGDGDFVPVLERMAERGIEVHVIGPDRRSAPELLIASHTFTNASRVPGLIELHPATTDTAGAVPDTTRAA